MINKPPPFKGLNIRIPIITPIKGRGFINQESGVPISGDSSKMFGVDPVIPRNSTSMIPIFSPALSLMKHKQITSMLLRGAV